MKTERIIVYVVIMVSLVLSVTALCRSLQRTAGFDYIGVIVGILALLVTALITWNIYSVVDFNRKKDELIRQEQIVKKLVTLVDEGLSKNAAVTEQSFSAIYLYLITKKEPMSLEYWYLNHALFAILRYSESGNFEVCNALIKMLMESVIDPSKIKIRKERLSEFLQITSQIKRKDKIENYAELVRIVSSLGIRA